MFTKGKGKGSKKQKTKKSQTHRIRLRKSLTRKKQMKTRKIIMNKIQSKSNGKNK